jgi:oxygen-independent coproporphyrinogen-3 oxidase
VPRDVPSTSFGVYIHVPFCAVRCGYCDFNTYAPGETDGATPDSYVEAALREMALARRVMGADPRPASTVFFGGGTPTMLDASALGALLDGVRRTWGLTADAEVTTEANPDSVSRESLAVLAETGFTRVSFGMQSAVSHVLATLDRTHRPENVSKAVGWAREAGLATSVDLIYGTPGESLEDWSVSVDAALALEPDHLSAYALVIEPGTRMGGQLRRGEIAATDPDAQADMYEIADEAFSAAGYSWYEVSNWARTPSDRCQHNIGYWTSQDWWGIGPGAHSYLGPRVDSDGESRGARRWWNVKHPRAYAERLAGEASPEQDGEDLSAADLELEGTMLRIRLADGIPVPPGRADTVASLIADGLVDGREAVQGTVKLTRRGRLLADRAVRELTA